MKCISIFILLTNIANASFSFRDEVKINKKCFKNSIYKCSKYRYMIIKNNNGVYKVAPAKFETIPTPCFDYVIKEQCLENIRKK